MQTGNAYIIDLNALQTDVCEREYDLDDAFFAREESKDLLGGDCKAKVKLQRRGGSFLLEMQVSGVVRCVCDRCLDEVTIPMDCEETLTVKLGRAVDTDEDIEWVDPADGELDLAWLLYELVEINLPLVIRHQEGECNPQMEELLRSHLCSLPEDETDSLGSFPEA